MSILEDARVFSAPIGVASYFRCLVTEEDQAKMNEVDAPCMFNEAQKALNRASVLHHKTFIRYWEELNQHEAETRGFTKNRDAYKLLREKLQAELEAARKEHVDLVEQLREEVDAVKPEAEEWKRNMDRLASEKDIAQAQLASTEVQLRAVKEKALVQAKKIEEFQSQLSSFVSNQENLAKDLEMAKSEAKVVKVDADEMVAVYKADVEEAQVRAKDIIEHAKRQSRRETLEEIHAWGFDLSTEIESAKELEVEAKKLAYPKDDKESEDSGESKGGGDPEGDDAAPDED
ncbi:uncharacterized protein [Nicotiana tomentosiformis]|uniref:uncharacterized protein n=1 Tax=Nicotiana tomentosiformis TaxID=4098 RepID=UPI00388C8A26